MPEATPRYLTKSRFKLALECPTKLFYSGKPQLYPDRREGDEFLQSLAEGGFQVGALAGLMFPGGVEVTARTHDGQLAETEQFLARQGVIIFEAAMRFGHLFIRIDVLKKVDNQVELIEIKAKGHDFTEPLCDVGAMRSYLQDVAFQLHVLRSRYPQLNVTSFLMLADKSAICTVQGLNQGFKVGQKAKKRLNLTMLWWREPSCATANAIRWPWWCRPGINGYAPKL